MDTKREIVWTEEHPLPNEPVCDAIIAIAIRLGPSEFEAVGTGFIVGQTKPTQAIAFSAAHVFDEIYRKHNPSEPRPLNPFTREKPQRIDLSPDKVFAFLFSQGRCHVLKLSNLGYDGASDVAIFNVEKVKPDGRHIFKHTARMDADLPEVGTRIEGIGFKHMKFESTSVGDSLRAMFMGCLTRRIGIVTEVLEKTHKLAGPGVIASFPIFGGMSGGPALKVRTGRAPAAFGILSSDWDDPIEQKYDRQIAGMTTIAKIPLKWVPNETGGHDAEIRFLSNDIGTGY